MIRQKRRVLTSKFHLVSTNYFIRKRLTSFQEYVFLQKLPGVPVVKRGLKIKKNRQTIRKLTFWEMNIPG